METPIVITYQIYLVKSLCRYCMKCHNKWINWPKIWNVVDVNRMQNIGRDGVDYNHKRWNHSNELNLLDNITLCTGAYDCVYHNISPVFPASINALLSLHRLPPCTKNSIRYHGYLTIFSLVHLKAFTSNNKLNGPW